MIAVRAYRTAFTLLSLVLLFSSCAPSRPKLVAAGGSARGGPRLAAVDAPSPAVLPDSVQIFELSSSGASIREVAVEGDAPGCVVMTRSQFQAALDEGLENEIRRLKRREARLKFGIESESAATHGSGRFADDEYDVGAGVDELVLERQTAKMIAAAEAAHEHLSADIGRRYLPGASPEGALVAIRCMDRLDTVKKVSVSVLTQAGERYTFGFRGDG